MYLFAQDDYNTGAAEYIAGQKQVRSVVVRLDGSLYAELVPCYRVSDETPGFYDIKRQRFLTNLGTDDLEIGPIVGREIIVNYSTDVPDIYKKLDYIETDGASYIDTRIVTRAIGNQINYDFRGYTESYSPNFMFGAQAYGNNGWLYGALYTGTDDIQVDYDEAIKTFVQSEDIVMTQSISNGTITITVNDVAFSCNRCRYIKRVLIVSY